MAKSENEGGFVETFYASDRQTAKAHADYPLTHEYIVRLERIAQAAYAFWSCMEAPTEPEKQAAGALFDALETVNFLDESICARGCSTRGQIGGMDLQGQRGETSEDRLRSVPPCQ